MFCLLLHCGVLCAGETTNELWPEAEFFYSLNNKLRLRFDGSLKRSEEIANVTSKSVEIDLDVNVKPIFNSKFFFDQGRGKLLTVRMGYGYISNSGEPNEQRLLAEGTTRIRLPSTFILGDRNRLAYRFMSGDQSIRYRNRIRIEREVSAASLRFNPYFSSEFFYDNKSKSWKTIEYRAGAEFYFIHRSLLEFYYARQDNRTSNATDVNAIGVVLQLHL
jgi:hypothetical protein